MRLQRQGAEPAATTHEASWAGLLGTSLVHKG